MKIDGLIERLEEEGYQAAADFLQQGGTLPDLVTKLEVRAPLVLKLVENWKKNRHGKERETRQRKRLQREVRDLGERTGERDRARRDRANLKRWIEEHTKFRVVGKSGSWTVELDTIEEAEAA